MTINFGKDAGAAFTKALQNIFNGVKCKLEKTDGSWKVIIKG